MLKKNKKNYNKIKRFKVLKYFLSFIIIINIVLALSGERIKEEEIIIEASPSEVWETIKDLNKYVKYDNYKIEKEGSLFLNSSLKYIVKKDDKINNIVSSNLIYINPNKDLVQTGGIPGILFYLNEISLNNKNGGTEVYIKTKETGLLVWIQNILTWDPTLPLLDTNIIKEETLKRFPPLP